MKRKRFGEEQITGILKEHKAEIAVSGLCRKHGGSDARIYRWKARYGGLGVPEAKQLEDENSKLADTSLSGLRLSRELNRPTGHSEPSERTQSWIRNRGKANGADVTLSFTAITLQFCSVSDV